jgi:hypothetical protein
MGNIYLGVSGLHGRGKGRGGEGGEVRENIQI